MQSATHCMRYVCITTGHTVCWTDDGSKESFYTFFSMNVGFYISSLWHMLWLAFVFFLFRHFEAVAVCVCFSSCSLRVTHLAQCFFFYFRLYLFFALTSKKILNAMDKNQHAGYSIFVLITCTGRSNAWRKYRFSLHTFAVFSRTMNILKMQLSK